MSSTFSCLVHVTEPFSFIGPCRYPDYEFISDNSISWSAGLHNRYTENSLRGVILDIHFLSQTDFLVCTFSSQVSPRSPDVTTVIIIETNN